MVAAALGSMLRRVGSQRSIVEEKPTTEDQVQLGGMRGVLQKARSMREMGSCGGSTICEDSVKEVASSQQLPEGDGGLRGFLRRATSLRNTVGERKEEEPQDIDLEPVLIMTDGNHGKVVFQNLEEETPGKSMGSNLSSSKHALDLSPFRATTSDNTVGSFPEKFRSSNVSETSSATCPLSGDDSSDSDSDSSESEANENQASLGLRSKIGSFFSRTNSSKDVIADRDLMVQEISLPALLAYDDDKEESNGFDGDDESEEDDEEDEEYDEDEEDEEDAVFDDYYNEYTEEQYYEYYQREYYDDETDFAGIGGSILQPHIPLYTIEEVREEDLANDGPSFQLKLNFSWH